MLMKALDLLRTLGWGIINFSYVNSTHFIRTIFSMEFC